MEGVSTLENLVFELGKEVGGKEGGDIIPNSSK